jgi:putative ATP-dependent endonuclease of the OLD family
MSALCAQLRPGPSRPLLCDPMRISTLRIENFRGIKAATVQFRRHNVLIGANNSGKTTVIEALALTFGRDRLVRPLTEHDFHGSNPGPEDRIRFVVTITGFEGDDPLLHGEWFRDGRGIPKWWNPLTGDVSPTRDDSDWQLACQIGYCARFDRPDLEIETVRYFHDDDSLGDVFVDEAVTPFPARLLRDVGFFLVPASRTWDRVMSFGSELFRRLVSSASAQPADAVVSERDRLRSPDLPLESDPHLASVVANIDHELAGYFTSKPSLRLRVTQTDSAGVLDAVVPHYAFDGTDIPLPARRHGSGLVSLQHLLLLLQFGRHRAESGEGFWLALEEPELHVPPPLQRRLVHRIQSLSTQTFVTTHSPTVGTLSDPRSVLVLKNYDGHVSAKRLADTVLGGDTPNAVRRLLQLHRQDTINALMHEVVLVPEGRIDHEWLGLLLMAVQTGEEWTDEWCRYGTTVCSVPTSDGAVVVTVERLASLHSRVIALVDGDRAGRDYASELEDAAAASAVICWPEAWTIEDVLCWIVDAEPGPVLDSVEATTGQRPSDMADLARRLKQKDRSAGGLKQDTVAYEAVAEAISLTAACRARARDVLNGLADVANDSPTSAFVRGSEGKVARWHFRP